MKGSQKFHFEEFARDPEAVKKLLNPFKQKMDLVQSRLKIYLHPSVERMSFERRRQAAGRSDKRLI